jgi:hypothetical protein
MLVDPMLIRTFIRHAAIKVAAKFINSILELLVPNR